MGITIYPKKIINKEVAHLTKERTKSQTLTHSIIIRYQIVDMVASYISRFLILLEGKKNVKEPYLQELSNVHIQDYKRLLLILSEGIKENYL